MIRALVVFSLRFPAVVLAAAGVLLVAGVLAVGDAPWDVFPEFSPPQVTVQTEAPGLSAEEVEQLVAVPVEAALGGLNHLAVLRSSSIPGLCVVTALFDDGADVLQARQLVNERLGEVRPLLPNSVDTPRLAPLVSSTSRLLMVGLTSDGVPQRELRTLADWTFRPRLQAVPGVAHVEVFGGEVKQHQVLVDPRRLQEYRLSLAEVLAAARQATAFGGAGFVETANQRLPIRQRTRIESAADLAAVPVAIREGVALPLGHVAQVETGAADRVGSALVNGSRGILLVVHKQPSSNTLEVTAGVQRALDELREALPEGVALHPALFRQATFIHRAMNNLSVSILFGCVLVAAVLTAFLFQWRTLLISLAAMPLSLLGAVLVLRACGASLNAMTLGGLAIALGEVVDDAIVDVENVLRRLHENARAALPRPPLDVILEASLEVRSAVVYASFIVILVFVPVFCLPGLSGKFFGPLGAAYVAAILVSLLVALTVTPAMCGWLLRNHRLGGRAETPLVRGLGTIYRRLLPPVLKRPGLTIAVAGGLLALAVAAVPWLGGEFLPDFREANFVVFMAGRADASLGESERVGQRLAARLREIPGVLSVAQQIGRADLSEDTWGPNISEVWLAADPRADYDVLQREVRAATEEFPGAVFQVKQFLKERIDEVLTGSTADIVVRVSGPQLPALREYAGRIAQAIEGTPGVEDLRVEQLVETPQVEVLLEPPQAAHYGLSVGEVNQAVQTLLRGTRVGQVFENDTAFDVVVRGAPEARAHPQQLGELLLDGPAGEKVPLRAVATLGIGQAPNMINREQGRRRLLVTCNAQGRDVASVTNEVRRRIGERAGAPPPGCYLEYAGEFAARSEAQRRLLWLGAASLVGIFLLLQMDFRSTRLALLVMISVPLACVGSVAAVVLAGGSVSLGSLVGLVTVFGIAVRNGILLVSNYEHRTAQPPLDRVLGGSIERLSPILMTAATTALAILPIVVAGNLPGNEIEHPMAIVITGGLVSSTLLTLFVLPACYGWVQSRRGDQGPVPDCSAGGRS